MSIVVELNSSLLAEAEHATGLSEPAALIERALKLIIRVEAYRAAALQRDFKLSEEEVLHGQDGPFMTVETYRPVNDAVPQTQEERMHHLSKALAELDADQTLTTAEKDSLRAAIELGGSEPTASAAPRRRFW